MLKSFARFNDVNVALSEPIFRAKIGSRGRPPKTFPNGDPVPNRQSLLAFITRHVLYQIDAVVDGPIFCKHLPLTHDRNRDSLYQVVLGAPPWSGVWEVRGNPRLFGVRAVYLPDERTWIPQIVLSPGNYWPVRNWNAFELSHAKLRAVIVRHRLVTAEEWDCFAHPDRAARERAIALATRGIWM